MTFGWPTGKISATLNQSRMPRMTAIYPCKYCRQSSGGLYWGAPQAAAFSGLYGSFAVYFTLEAYAYKTT